MKYEEAMQIINAFEVWCKNPGDPALTKKKNKYTEDQLRACLTHAGFKDKEITRWYPAILERIEDLKSLRIDKRKSRLTRKEKWIERGWGALITLALMIVGHIILKKLNLL